MLQIPIRVGRSAAKNTIHRRRTYDSSFVRASIVAICGAAAVVSLLSFSAAGNGSTPASDLYDRSKYAAVAVTVDTVVKENAAVDSDGSVWTYIESLMRKLIGDESE